MDLAEKRDSLGHPSRRLLSASVFIQGYQGFSLSTNITALVGEEKIQHMSNSVNMAEVLLSFPDYDLWPALIIINTLNLWSQPQHVVTFIHHTPNICTLPDFVT